MLGQAVASSALSAMYDSWPAGTSSSAKMASTGHSGMQTAQSMHSSGSMTSMFGPSRKQSTGQTSTQSVYLQRMQDSTTTWVMMDGEKREDGSERAILAWAEPGGSGGSGGPGGAAIAPMKRLLHWPL